MKAGESALLSQTGRGTPMGELLRRYWTPALLSRELAADGAPVRVRLMGEDLIAFRDSQGRVGLLDQFCSHRGASLYYARNGDSGLRCWYHGWKYDVEGNCLETPNEPAASRLHERIRHTAYPCREKNGVVWAYLGPRETMPDMPELEHLLVPESHHYVSKRHQRCHWTQGMEGDMDPSHIAHLHAAPIAGRQGTPAAQSAVWVQEGLAPKIEVIHDPARILFAARRDAGEDGYFWRIAQWFMPFFTTVPAHSGNGPLFGHAWVPRDDESTWTFTFTWHPQRPITEEEVQGFLGGNRTHSELIPGTFDPVANKSNEYGRDAPPAPQPWMRITRIQDQDVAMTEGIGPRFNRARENLGSNDHIIARVRANLLDAAAALEQGKEPPRNPKDYRLRPHSARLPRTVTAWADALAEPLDTRPETYRASA